MKNPSSWLMWIPLLPLLGAAINLLVGRMRSRNFVHTIAIGSVLGALAITLYVVFGHIFPMWQAAGGHGASPKISHEVFSWIVAGSVNIGFGLTVDTLTSVMLVTITFVGFLIHVYSMGYMDHDEDYARFFGYLNLFTGSMLILVLGDSLVVLFVGWEGVGLCSYLLIGFWYDKSGTEEFGWENSNAGKKAFIVNRIGDFAFIIGMFVIFYTVGSLRFDDLAANAKTFLTTFPGTSFTVAALAGLLLFIGATGKSAQIPLFVWLPDAMAGPTPVSALIHAATMVTAGVYMVARMNFMYMLTPGVMGIIALIGALTAFFAATIGFAQNDIKKVLAYSTVSQLGYMFVGVGMGAYAAGIFHVFTHAFFKACLFLGAGAVIHALHGQQDIRHMGGLKKKLPITHLTFLVSTIAIAGIPVFSGFFSKDEILWKAISTANPAYGTWFPYLIYVLGMAGAICTAFYMFRLYSLTFLGECRLSKEEEAKIHPPGPAMAMPLMVLAIGAAILGFLGLPGVIAHGHANFFHNWLHPVVGQGELFASTLMAKGSYAAPNHLSHSHALEWGLMILSALIAAGSSYVAYKMYNEGPSQWAAQFVRKWRNLHALIEAKYKIDELYDAIIIKPIKGLAWFLWKVIDVVFIDGLGVNIIGGRIAGLVGRLAQVFQTGNIQHYIIALLIGMSAVIFWVSKPPASFKVTAAGYEQKHYVEPGAQVQFDATPAVKADQRELEYRWDFDGDGKWDVPADGKGWSSNPKTAFIYHKADRYRVVLSVRDKRWETITRKTLRLQVGTKKAIKEKRKHGKNDSHAKHDKTAKQMTTHAKGKEVL